MSPSLRMQSVVGGKFRVLRLAAERRGGCVYEAEGPSGSPFFVACSSAMHERAIDRFRAAALAASAVDLGTSPTGFAYAVVADRARAIALVEAGLATGWSNLRVTPQYVELASEDLVDAVEDDEETIPNPPHVQPAPKRPRRVWVPALAAVVLAAAAIAACAYRPSLRSTDAEPPAFQLEPTVSPVVIESRPAPRATDEPSEPAPSTRRTKTKRSDDPMTL